MTTLHSHLLNEISRAVPPHLRKRKNVFAVEALKMAIRMPFFSDKAKHRFTKSLVKHNLGALVSSLAKLEKQSNSGRLVDVTETQQDVTETQQDVTETQQDVTETQQDATDGKSVSDVSTQLTRLVRVGVYDKYLQVPCSSPNIEFHETDFVCEITPTPKRAQCLSLGVDIMSATSRSEWLEAQDDAILDALWSRLSRYEVLSLDVFDTFALRGGEAEATRFLEFSSMVLIDLRSSEFEPLVQNVSAEGLTLARARGMQHTYRFRPHKQGCNEGSIVEVAKYVSSFLGGNDRLTERLLDLEVQFEATKLRRNPLLSPLMHRFKDAGKRVILISDMYLHANQIEKIVKLVDPTGFEAVDKIYSSADTILNKRDGKLFGFVEKDFGLKPDLTVHIGDSSRSDVERAREAGWNAMHFPISRPEIASRQASLVETIAHFDERGIDTRDWAKV